MNTLLICDEATLVVKLNTQDKAVYERSAMLVVELHSNEFSWKVLSADLPPGRAI